MKKKQPSIAQLNAAFKKAKPEQRRVMIAKDALKQLKAEKFIASPGTWAAVRYSSGASPHSRDALQPILLKPGISCKCCGAGAIFLSHVRLANEAAYGAGGAFSLIQNATQWPVDNLRLIELAFEGGDGCHTAEDGNDDAAVDFGGDYEEPTNRLIAILRNVIANNGTFDPSRS